MYGIIRIFIGLVMLALGSLVAWKRGWFARKAVRILLFVGMALVTTVLHFIPVENAFHTFDSPEAVYRYLNPEAGEVIQVVEGGDTALVVARKGDTDSLLIVPRGDGGWKIGIAAHTHLTDSYYHDGVMVQFLVYGDTNSGYVAVFHTEGGEIDIRHSENSEFHAVQRYDANLDRSYVTYYAYVDQFTDSYCIWINGEPSVL